MKGVNIYEEASRCLLCQDAPCTKACQHGAPRVPSAPSVSTTLSWLRAG